MIKNASISKEVVVTAENKIGLLNKISKLVADHGINIDGVAGYAADNQAKIMMVTSDATRAVEALLSAGFKSAKESEIIILELENKPGALRIVTDKLAAQNVDIRYLYGTACCGSCADKLILSTSDNLKALVAFKK
ncbi:MAG: ACT domain-containing protein [Candidatus Omnitrophica bacterium]|nr:ACT domain-containing protein [Candidatus Omnitrophota bacterium]